MVKGFGSKLNKVLKLNEKINELVGERIKSLDDLKIIVPSKHMEGIAFCARFVCYDPTAPHSNIQNRKIGFNIEVLELVEHRDGPATYDMTMSDKTSVHLMSAVTLLEYAEFRKDFADACAKFDVLERKHY